MYGVLLYCYSLSFVSIDQLAKSRIFLSLFSRDPTLWAYRGAIVCHHTFSISNLTLGPRLHFSQTHISLSRVTFRVFPSYFVFPFKIKKK